MHQRNDSRRRAIRLGAGVIVAAVAMVTLAVALVVIGRPAGGPSASSAPPSLAVVGTHPASTPASPVWQRTPGTSAAAPTDSPDVASPTASAASPVASPAAVIDLVAVGDIGRCDATGDDDTGALVAGLPGVVATLGDTAYPAGTAQQLRDCFGGGWATVKDRIRFAVTGNHDDMTDAGAPLRDYLGAAAARDGHTYFSEDLGAWHVVVLDADCDIVKGGCGADSPQVRWLRDDLAASGARCTLGLWHQPRFSSGQHGDDAAVGPFWDALHAAGADLVLNGHDHDYERLAPQDPSGNVDAARGITEIVVGTGGGDLRDFKAIERNSVARVSGTYGVLALTLSDGSWSYRFVGTKPGFTDQGTGACH